MVIKRGLPHGDFLVGGGPPPPPLPTLHPLLKTPCPPCTHTRIAQEMPVHPHHLCRLPRCLDCEAPALRLLGWPLAGAAPTRRDSANRLRRAAGGQRRRGQLHDDARDRRRVLGRLRFGVHHERAHALLSRPPTRGALPAEGLHNSAPTERPARRVPAYLGRRRIVFARVSERLPDFGENDMPGGHLAPCDLRCRTSGVQG